MLIQLFLCPSQPGTCYDHHLLNNNYEFHDLWATLKMGDLQAQKQ